MADIKTRESLHTVKTFDRVQNLAAKTRKGVDEAKQEINDTISSGESSESEYAGNRLEAYESGTTNLAVRAGDAEHLHLTLRVSVEGCGHFGHGLSCVFDDDLRYGKRQFALREQSDGARFDRGFRKGMSVEKLADDAAEHAPLLHLS